MKACRKCGLVKPLEEYYKSSAGTRDGRRHECKTCWRDQSNKYHMQPDNRKKRLAAGKERHYIKNYGITRDEFLKMREKAGGCEVCGDTNTVLDHCHDSAQIRGVLCNRCNQALGSMRDNPSLIRSLAEYMDKHLSKKKEHTNGNRRPT